MKVKADFAMFREKELFYSECILKIMFVLILRMLHNSIKFNTNSFSSCEKKKVLLFLAKL